MLIRQTPPGRYTFRPSRHRRRSPSRWRPEYRHIDTAAASRNRAETGAAIAASSLTRDELFVTTKVQNNDQVRDGPTPGASGGSTPRAPRQPPASDAGSSPAARTGLPRRPDRRDLAYRASRWCTVCRATHICGPHPSPRRPRPGPPVRPRTAARPYPAPPAHPAPSLRSHD